MLRSLLHASSTTLAPCRCLLQGRCSCAQHPLHPPRSKQRCSPSSSSHNKRTERSVAARVLYHHQHSAQQQQQQYAHTPPPPPRMSTSTSRAEHTHCQCVFRGSGVQDLADWLVSVCRHARVHC